MSKLNVKNAQFLIGTAAGIPATVVGQVRSGSVDLGEQSLIDSTVITDGTKQKVPGVRESMSGTVTVAWDPADTQHAAVMTKYLGKTLGSIGFKLRTTAASPTDIVHFYGDGYFTNVSAPIASNAGDALMEATFSFKLTGRYTQA